MIPQINKILYATDLTTNSAYAFYFAADMAQKYDAHITILHCMGFVPPQMFYEPGGLYPEDILKKAKEQEKGYDIAEIKRRLDEFSKRAGSRMGSSYPKIIFNIIVREGYAVEEILNTADEEGCDMIVLGTHSKGWLKQAFLGSVARSVMERTRKPTFLIPLPSEKTEIDWDTI